MKSGEWRTAGNMISCAWAQVITRAAAGHSVGAVRLRADTSRGFGVTGAAAGQIGRRLALLFGGQAAAGCRPRSAYASSAATTPPSLSEAVSMPRRAAAGPPSGRRRAAAGQAAAPGLQACRSRVRIAQGLRPQRARPRPPQGQDGGPPYAPRKNGARDADLWALYLTGCHGPSIDIYSRPYIKLWIGLWSSAKRSPCKFLVLLKFLTQPRTTH